MATIDLAEYKYKLSLDSSLYDSKMSQAGIQAETMQGKLFNVGNVMKTAIVGGLVAVGVAVGATIKESVEKFADFETSLNKVATIADTTVLSMGEIKSGIMEVSNEVNIGSGQISEAMYQAISATGDTANALSYVEQSAKLAKGGFTDVTSALDGATSVMNAYGETGEESFTKIADIMITTQNVGKTTVNELSSSLANVIPTAAAMGVSFEQVSAGLATITAQGTPTAQATTQLNTLFAELGKSGTLASGNLTKAAEGTQYAGKSFSELTNEGVPLNDILLLMSDYAAANGVSLIDMFSSVEAGKGALQIASGDGAKFAKSLEAMNTASGATDAAYNTMSQGLNESFSRIRNSIDNILIKAGDKIAPSFQKVADWVNNHMPQIEAVVEGVLDGMGTAITVFTDIVSGIISIFSATETSTNGTFTSIKETISSVLTVVGELVDSFITLFTTIWDKWGADITAFCQTYFTDIMNVIKNALAFIQSIIKTITALISGDWKGFLDGLASICSNGWKLIESIFKTYTDLMKGIVSAAFEIIKTVVSTIFEAIKSKITEIWSNIITSITTGFNNVVDYLQQLPEKIATQLSNVIDKVNTWKTDFINKAKEAGTNMVSGVIDKVKELPSKIKEKLDSAIEKVESWKDSLVSKGASAAKGLYDSVVEKVSELPSKLVSVGGNIVEGMWDGITNKTDWIIKKIGGFTSSVLKAMKDFFGIKSPSRLMRDEVGKYLAQGIGVGFEDEIDSVNKQITDSINTDFGIDANVSTGITGSSILQPSQLNLSDTYSNQSSLSGLSDLLSKFASKESFQLNIGDIVLQGVQNEDDLADAIINNIGNALTQSMSKRKMI